MITHPFLKVAIYKKSEPDDVEFFYKNTSVFFFLRWRARIPEGLPLPSEKRSGLPMTMKESRALETATFIMFGPASKKVFPEWPCP